MEFMQRISHQLIDPLEEEKDEESFIVLGIYYPAILTQQQQDKKGVSGSGFLNSFFSRNDEENPDFLLDVHSRIHLTYRTRFAPIPRAADGPSPLSFHFLFRDNPLNTIENVLFNSDCFNTDIGWGCMIRTGQSLLANAIQIALLGRGFRVNEDGTGSESEILGMFMDNFEAPFSIHNFVKKGLELSNKKPGEWFGPAATSRSIQSLLRDFSECGLDECLISVSSGDVYEEEVEELLGKNENGKILLLLGVKLGINGINEYYWDEIKEILGSEFSVGIAGGRPSSSLYFIGYRNNELIYLDPHNPQPSVQPGNESLFYESCHTVNYGKLSLSDLDPSMLIGILISGRDHWVKWKESTKSSRIFNVLNKRPSDFDIACDDEIESINSDSNDNGLLVEGDYVDVKPFSQLHCNSCCEIDDSYQDVQCKKQQIMVMDDNEASSNAVDVEVEKVLVERETIDMVDGEALKLATE